MFVGNEEAEIYEYEIDGVVYSGDEIGIIANNLNEFDGVCDDESDLGFMESLGSCVKDALGLDDIEMENHAYATSKNSQDVLSDLCEKSGYPFVDFNNDGTYVIDMDMIREIMEDFHDMEVRMDNEIYGPDEDDEDDEEPMVGEEGITYGEAEGTADGEQVAQASTRRRGR